MPYNPYCFYRAFLHTCDIYALSDWLLPLLTRVRDNPRRVVCPVIDSLAMKSLHFSGFSQRKQLFIGAFTWDLGFNWKFQTADMKLAGSRDRDTDPLRYLLRHPAHLQCTQFRPSTFQLLLVSSKAPVDYRKTVFVIFSLKLSCE